MNGTPKSWFASFPLEPVAKGRPRLGKFGAYTPAKTKKAEGELRYFISQSSPYLFEGAIYVKVEFCFVRPKTAKKRTYHTVRPDTDNLGKGVLDAANGLLWRDDSQIVELILSKKYDDKPSINIFIKDYV